MWLNGEQHRTKQVRYQSNNTWSKTLKGKEIMKHHSHGLMKPNELTHPENSKWGVIIRVPMEKEIDMLMREDR